MEDSCSLPLRYYFLKCYRFKIYIFIPRALISLVDNSVGERKKGTLYMFQDCSVFRTFDPESRHLKGETILSCTFRFHPSFFSVSPPSGQQRGLAPLANLACCARKLDAKRHVWLKQRWRAAGWGRQSLLQGWADETRLESCRLEAGKKEGRGGDEEARTAHSLRSSSLCLQGFAWGLREGERLRRAGGSRAKGSGDRA